MVFKILGRIFGRIFGGLGRSLMAFFRWLARHEAALGLTTVVIAVVVGVWLLLTLLNVNIVIGTPQAGPAPVVSSQAASAPATTDPTPAPVAHTNAPAATEAFMTGQINGNADQVWNALSAELHNSLSSRGQDKIYYQNLFKNLKTQGIVYTGYQYVGGVNNDDGTSLQFYVLNATDKTKKVVKIPYNFLVDNKEGQILQIDGPSSSQ